MDFANPVKLLGRILLLVYSLSGGSNDSQPLGGATHQPADKSAASSERMRPVREKAARQQQKDVLQEIEDMLQETQRLCDAVRKARQAADERLEAERRAQQQLIDEKLREIERVREELRQLQDHSDSLQRRIDELRKNEARQQMSGSQHQEPNPHSRRAAILGHISRPAGQLDAMRSIDGNGWRVDRQGIIRDRQNQPIGVWGIDDGEPAVKRKR